MRHDKKLEALELFTFRIAPETIKAIRDKAKQLGVSTGEIIRRCVTASIGKLK